MSIVIVGQPKNPYGSEIVAAVTDAVNTIDDIKEAHMPQWLEPESNEPSEQVLVVMLKRSKNPNKIMPKLMRALAERLPDGADIPALPICEDDPLLSNIRGANMRLTLQPKKSSLLSRIFG